MKAILVFFFYYLISVSIIAQEKVFIKDTERSGYVELSTDSAGKFTFRGKVYKLFKQRMTEKAIDVIYPKNDITLDGDWIVLYEGDTQPYMTCSFLSGKKNGNSYTYDLNGQLRHLMPYLNGKTHGTYFIFNEKGHIIWERNFVQGVTHGRVVRYNEDGLPFEEYLYSSGTEVGYRQWNEKGKMIKEELNYKVEREYESYHPFKYE